VIKSSLEWSQLETKLQMRSNLLPDSNARDVRKMLNNIKSSVTELSKAEVNARRRRSNVADEVLKKVNDEIELLEEYLLMATLLG
jgi:reverse gyrase